MAVNVGLEPKITWGPAFGNTVTFGYPIDQVRSYSTPRAGSQKIQLISGVEITWIWGYDYILDFQFRWIPAEDAVNPTQTGWDGATGIRAFLEYAVAAEKFRFFPDKDSASYILSTLVQQEVQPDLEAADGTKIITLTIRNPDTAYTGY